MEFLDTSFLVGDELKLVLDRAAPADPVRGWAPAYHFHICLPDGTRIGRCDLRVGQNRSLYYGGNIGYGSFPTTAGGTMPKKPAACCSSWRKGTSWAG